MRILEIAPLWESVPPPAYGGTEAVVSLLTEALVAAGHEVTLAASGDSTTSADHLATYERSLRRADDLTDRNPYDWQHIGAALRRAGEFDIVHNHAGELAMAMSQLVKTPVLTTMHCLITPDTRFIWERYEGAYNAISRSQKRHMPEIDGPARYAGFVYNGIDVKSFPYQEEKGEDLLFLSRIAPEKGTELAVEVAKRTGRRLIIAGKVDNYDRVYFEEVVRDLIDGDQIVFFGEADATQKRELYRDAKCLLMPLRWEEPFGLVMPEANACGTPVIALRRGSAPEVVAHGESGFVVDTVDEMVEAVQEIHKIEPRRCREHVAARFSSQVMAAAYVEVFHQIVDLPRGASRITVEAAPAGGKDTDKTLAVA